MFDDLDKINWTNLQHVYSSGEGIPESIRSLLSNNPEEVTDALDFLFGVQQDTGTVAETTPLIIPYVLDLLGKLDVRTTEKFLIKLDAVAENMTRPWQFTFHRQRNVVKTYDALLKGLEIYFQLLNHNEPKIRWWAIELLQYLTEDNVQRIAAELRSRFDIESEETIKVQIVEKLGKIVARLPAIDAQDVVLRQQYSNFYRHLVLTENPSKVRVAAAFASLSIFYIPIDSISPTIAQILVQEFLLETDSYRKRDVVKAMSRWKPEPLLDLLANPAITPEDAHLIVRGILAAVLTHSTDKEAHWEIWPDRFANDRGKFYAIHQVYTSTVVTRNSKFFKPIIESEKFWETPTNMFSAFFALSDSRVALGAMLEKPDD